MSCKIGVMVIDPNNIELSPEQKRQLADFSERTGRPWDQVLSEALTSFCPKNGPRHPDAARSFYDVMKEDGAIGVVRGGLPQDLSTNPKHLEGFGCDCEPGSD